MLLEVGNVKRIDDPSAADLEHYLQFMPPTAQFLILSSEAGRYIQAKPEFDLYRVEYRLNDDQYFVITPLEEALALFESFRNGDDRFKTLAKWRRLTVLNDPMHPAALIVMLILGLFLLGLALRSVFFPTH